MLAGGVGLFLKAVQHVDCICKLGHVHHPVPAVLQINDDLFGAAAHFVKWLPVIWLQPKLHLTELPARLALGLYAEQAVVAQVSVGRSAPVDRFFWSLQAVELYLYLYMISNA